MGNCVYDKCFFFHIYDDTPFDIVTETGDYIDYYGTYLYARRPLIIRRKYYKCQKCQHVKIEVEKSINITGQNVILKS